MTHTSSRTRNLGIAGGLAALAAILTLLYVSHGSGDRAQAAASSTDSVLVATADLPVGTSLSNALAGHTVVSKKLPVAAIEPGTLASATGLGNDVVVQPIFKGEQVSQRRLGPSSAAGVRSVVAGKMRVLQVPGDGNQLLAGTLQDGDHVDVVASLKKGEQQTPYTKTVLTNVLVLQAPEAESSSSVGSSALSATVAVTDGQAQSLFYVLENGNWTFVLRPAKGSAAAR
jgi:Flp pilus assembly protein CpaB